MARPTKVLETAQKKIELDAHAVAKALLEVIDQRGINSFKNTVDVKGTRRVILEEVEQRLGEIAAMCGFTPAEGARLLLGLSVAITKSSYAAGHRLPGGLIEEVIPIIAEELYNYGQLRTKEN